MAYRWREPIRPGVWYCYEHGPIKPVERVVPVCPDCGRMAMLGVRSKGPVVVRIPGPKACPNGHDLTKRARVTHRPCKCGGHTVWTCADCGEETVHRRCAT